VVDPASPRPVPRPMTDGIVFEDVTFNYPDTARTALADIDLHIRPGEVTALVGANGSGKTTIVKLMCRLYDPQHGRVLLDGVDLREVSPTELRRGISVIFQDFVKYQFTARQNIWVGNVGLAQDDPAIEAAARAAGADAVIEELGRGYDSMLGKWFEEGEELSIGEWQRVALARAFVRDAEILVFDEPTSALDPVSEWQAFEHIRALSKGRAVVLISHRFSTVRNADRIHIVEHGRIVESGTHDELMALDGRYARMYEVQARAYRTTVESS
jgi:ATP-binding cassette subfamily B protein